MSHRPTSFTVAIPTHNRRETVLLAVRSVLGQTRPPDQVLVIADGCTDGTVEALQALNDDRVQPIDLAKGRGFAYGNRNAALDRATGDVVAWCADDDLWLPDHLERVGELYDLGAADIVTTLATIVEADDTMVPMGVDWRVPRYRELLFAGFNRVTASAVTHTTEIGRVVGGWRDDLPRGGDADLWTRMLHAGARPSFVGAPTVLHFRATGRAEQDIAARVQQNERHFARISDPSEVIVVRSELARIRQLHRAHLEALWERAEDRAQELENELLTLRERSAELDLVYAGGWWRLRERLSPAIGLTRRLVDRARQNLMP